MSKAYTLYGHFNSGPTYKVALMLNLMGEPFAFNLINLGEREHKSPDYLARNRYGQVPCLHDGEQHFSQSASILQYLADKHGKFAGKTPQERAHIREWMFWEFDRLAPGVFRTRAYEKGIRQADPAVKQNYRADGEAGLTVLNDWLAERKWLVGDEPTIADVDVYGVVHLAPEGNFDLTKYPNLAAWVKRMEALPGYVSREAGIPKESRP